MLISTPLTTDDFSEDLRLRWIAARQQQAHPELEPEEVELIVAGIATQVSKLDRMIGSVCLYQGGLNEYILDTMQTMRVLTAQMRTQVLRSQREARP